MALTEIPTKLIEKSGTLYEKKMEIAAQLTQLIHAEGKDEKKVMQTFLDTLEEMQSLGPQDQIKPPHMSWTELFLKHKIKLSVFAALAVIVITIILCIFIYLFTYKS